MTLRTDAELDQALKELAEREHISKQEVIRKAVLDRRDRLSHADEVQDSSRRMLEKWGPVLDRLGSV